MGAHVQSREGRKGVRLKKYRGTSAVMGFDGKRSKGRDSNPGEGWEPIQRLRVCDSCYGTMEAAFQIELAEALGKAAQVRRDTPPEPQYDD